MKKKLSKGITALMLVFLLLPLKVHASGPAEEPEIAGMTEEEAAYYLRLCETGAGSLMRGIFTNVNLHVLKDDGQLMVVCATNTSEIEICSIIFLSSFVIVTPSFPFRDIKFLFYYLMFY